MKKTGVVTVPIHDVFDQVAAVVRCIIPVRMVFDISRQIGSEQQMGVMRVWLGVWDVVRHDGIKRLDFSKRG